MAFLIIEGPWIWTKCPKKTYNNKQPFEFVFLYREFSFFGLHTHIDVWIKYIRLTSQRTRPTKSELDKNHLPNPSQ